MGAPVSRVGLSTPFAKGNAKTRSKPSVGRVAELPRSLQSRRPSSSTRSQPTLLHNLIQSSPIRSMSCEFRVDCRRLVCGGRPIRMYASRGRLVRLDSAVKQKFSWNVAESRLSVHSRLYAITDDIRLVHLWTRHWYCGPTMCSRRCVASQREVGIIVATMWHQMDKNLSRPMSACHAFDRI